MDRKVVKRINIDGSGKLRVVLNSGTRVVSSTAPAMSKEGKSKQATLEKLEIPVAPTTVKATAIVQRWCCSVVLRVAAAQAGIVGAKVGSRPETVQLQPRLGTAVQQVGRYEETFLRCEKVGLKKLCPNQAVASCSRVLGTGRDAVLVALWPWWRRDSGRSDPSVGD